MSASPGHAGDRSPGLAHHFETRGQQFSSAKLGMWIFLATEILLFGGLFCAYAVYRANHPEIFSFAHRYLDRGLGAINTAILLASSFTMAWAVRAAQLGKKRALLWLLSLTLLGGVGFLGVKLVEYEHKWKHGLLWGQSYRPVSAEGSGHAGVAPRPDAGTETAASEAEPRNVQIFFSIYFLMTGLHGLHVLGGLVAIGWLLARAGKGAFGPEYFTPVDLVGLYWHLVDLIWIYLFPLLYLIH